MKIQNYRRVAKSDTTQMSVVAPTILDFGRKVLNFISFFFIGSITKTKGVDTSFLWMLLHLEFTLKSLQFL